MVNGVGSVGVISSRECQRPDAVHYHASRELTLSQEMTIGFAATSDEVVVLDELDLV